MSHVRGNAKELACECALRLGLPLVHVDVVVLSDNNSDSASHEHLPRGVNLDDIAGYGWEYFRGPEHYTYKNIDVHVSDKPSLPYMAPSPSTHTTKKPPSHVVFRQFFEEPYHTLWIFLYQMLSPLPPQDLIMGRGRETKACAPSRDVQMDVTQVKCVTLCHVRA